LFGAALAQANLFVPGLRTRIVAVGEVLTRLHGQEQQIKAENENENGAESFHSIEIIQNSNGFAPIFDKKTAY